MAWNPEKYNQFKTIRYKPFFDLTELISPGGLERCVDVGCGTGEQTKILSDRFEGATFLGIDPSPEMLAKSQEWQSGRLTFRMQAVEDFLKQNTESWDLIFSNAALQWSDHHEILFPQLIAALSEHGQLAVQMPVQKENVLNQILLELVQEKPFCDLLNAWKRETPMLSVDQYATILFENGLKELQLIQKVYPIIADTPDQFYDFIAGSALIPYLERMPEAAQPLFIETFKERIRQSFKKFPSIYAFKRLLLYGRR